MADLDLVGRCAGFRVTVHDGGSRQEIHCMAVDEQSVRYEMMQRGYGVITSIERVLAREFQRDPLYQDASERALSRGGAREFPIKCYITSRLRE